MHKKRNVILSKKGWRWGIYSHVYRFFSNRYCLLSNQRPLKGRFQEYRSVKLSEHNNGKTHFGTILISWWLRKFFCWTCHFPIMIKTMLVRASSLLLLFPLDSQTFVLSFFCWMARTCYCVLIWVNSFFFSLVFLLANYSPYDILKITTDQSWRRGQTSSRSQTWVLNIHVNYSASVNWKVVAFDSYRVTIQDYWFID